MRNIFALFVFTVFLSACTAQGRARSFGGSAQIDLAPGQKLVNVTWKETDLWFVTRPMRPGETAETYTFRESSTWGIVEGAVELIEHGK